MSLQQEKVSTQRLIGNKRSKELHLPTCPWGKMIIPRNKVEFSSVLEAQGKGYRDNCEHCFSKDNFLSDFRKRRSNLTFFKSRVHNEGKEGNNPTYSVLHLAEKFDTNDKVVSYANKNKITKIFLIFAGQQNPYFGHGENIEGLEQENEITIDDEGDRWFARQLTGADKINSDYQYRVHASDEYTSVAYELYKKYVQENNCNDAIIIDVLNAKYNWEKSNEDKEEVQDYMLDVIYNQIYSKLDEEVKENLTFYICGFSRGAVFSLEIADLLADKNIGHKIGAVITIDPVIRKSSKERMIFSKSAFGLWAMPFGANKHNAHEGDDGHYYSELRPWPKLRWCDFFPILKGNSFTINYNVFQRLGIYTFQACKMPIGSGVKGAISPKGDNDVFSQHDFLVNEHTPGMLDKYWAWMLSVLNAEIEKEGSLAAFLCTEVKVSLFKNGAPCPDTVDRGDTITIQANVENRYADNQHVPVEGKELMFYGDVYGEYNYIGTASTNARGIAEVQFSIPYDAPAGMNRFKVVDNEGVSYNCGQIIHTPKVVSEFYATPKSFRQNTILKFRTHGAAKIKIEIYNNLNMHRRTLTNRDYMPGEWEVKWDGKNASRYTFKYATKGEYKAKMTVYDLDGYESELVPEIHLTKTEWRP